MVIMLRLAIDHIKERGVNKLVHEIGLSLNRCGLIISKSFKGDANDSYSLGFPAQSTLISCRAPKQAHPT